MCVLDGDVAISAFSVYILSADGSWSIRNTALTPNVNLHVLTEMYCYSVEMDYWELF